jgi:ubiquinone/menaquinone biosynthesis C-methylase UbiE
MSLGDSAMVYMNVEQVAFPEASFDLILDSHVLECVEGDFRRGMCELWRVLKPGSTMLLAEAYTYGVSHTVEFGTPNPQAGYVVRKFDEDLHTFLEEAGFHVTRFDYTERNDASGAYFFFCTM